MPRYIWGKLLSDNEKFENLGAGKGRFFKIIICNISYNNYFILDKIRPQLPKQDQSNNQWNASPSSLGFELALSIAANSHLLASPRLASPLLSLLSLSSTSCSLPDRHRRLLQGRGVLNSSRVPYRRRSAISECAFHLALRWRCDDCLGLAIVLRRWMLWGAMEFAWGNPLSGRRVLERAVLTRGAACKPLFLWLIICVWFRVGRRNVGLNGWPCFQGFYSFRRLSI